MSPHVAPFQEALQAIDLLAGWAGGWMCVERNRDDQSRLFWHRCGDARGLVDLVRSCDERYSDEILLRLPEPKRWNGGPSGGSILWCRISGSDQLERARRFRPLPTLVLQEGASTRRLLVWGLTDWLGYFDLEEANRKIAYRLRAVQKDGVPENLRIPCPGSCLRVGRQRPAPVVVGRLTTDVYAARQVVGRLKAPPEQKWWEKTG